MNFKKKLTQILSRSYYNVAKKILALEKGIPETRTFFKSRTLLAVRVLFTRIKQNVLEFLIITLLDPAESFNFLKKRDEFSVCTSSYVEYRLYSRKLRLMSIGGVSVVILTSLIVSLVTSFIFPRFGAEAATFTFVQTDWSGGASTTATANHASNRTGWTYFFSKDDSIRNTATSVTAHSTISKTQTNNTDFTAGTASFTSVSGTGAGASVIPTIPSE
jgi:hypothetical protein